MRDAADTGPKAKLLLVEDEPLVLLDERRKLALRGYEVETARSAAEAIAAAERAEDIDLLVTDVDLGPGMDGIEAAKAILGMRPMPVVFLSSCDESDIRERAAGIGTYGFLDKAQSTAALYKAVEAALAGGTHGPGPRGPADPVGGGRDPAGDPARRSA
ncbi:MAG TPA: response regulator [Spirochaetales bacterium]|nr:response regulator [Spirochaetales bacterium]HRY53404.1 response regulator [Spirochaetia bacterium]HRZ63546.1 response regulator [Spirochaetia bacterium]